MVDALTPRLRPGARELTSQEAAELRRLHSVMQALPWMAADKARALDQLAAEVTRLHDDRVPLSHLGLALGVTRQRAHQLLDRGRAAS